MELTKDSKRHTSISTCTCTLHVHVLYMYMYFTCRCLVGSHYIAFMASRYIVHSFNVEHNNIILLSSKHSAIVP